MKPIFIFLFIMCTFLCTHTANASDSTTFRRTDIYAMASIGEYAALSLNADHYFLNKNLWHFGVTGGVCQYGTFSGLCGYQAPLALTGLFGREHHFIEVQTGALFRKEETKGENKKYDNSILGFAVLGYNFRYGHFLFKANASTSLVVQAGVGFIF